MLAELIWYLQGTGGRIVICNKPKNKHWLVKHPGHDIRQLSKFYLLCPEKKNLQNRLHLYFDQVILSDQVRPHHGIGGLNSLEALAMGPSDLFPIV